MNTKKNTIKLITTFIIGFVALILSGLGLLKFKKPINSADAYGVNSIIKPITNSNFDADSTNSYPDESFSGFTAYNGNSKESNTTSDPNITAGIIDLSVDEWKNKFPYAKDKSWNKKADKVLMIDSTTEKDGVTTKHVANYGYRTNSAISMDADSRYMVTVYVYTATDAGIASLYLYDEDGKEFSSIKKINSYNDFTPYSFFIKTNNSESLSLTLGLYLQGAGSVLFDNISVEKLSENEYNFVKNSTAISKYTEIDEVDNIVTSYYVNSTNELVNISDSNKKSNFTADVYEFTKNTTSPKSINDSDGNNTKALFLKNSDKTYAQYTTVNDFLTFEQNMVYKVAVNVKTNNLNGTASLQLVRTDIKEEDYEKNNYNTDLNKTIKITSNTTSSSEESVTNDYKTYSFLINSHPSKKTSFRLVVGLGIDSSTLTTGEMYISGIEVSKINYSTFNSSSSYDQKIDLAEKYAYSSSSIYLANGEFDAFKIEDYNKPMPATPVSWNVTTGKNTQKYGVINTSSTSFSNLAGLSNPVNPDTDGNDNVLMMYNETADTLIYTSSTKKLEANTYHKFEIDVQTQNAPLKISLVSTKNETEIELSSITVNTEYMWIRPVTLLLYTGYQAIDVSVKLTFDTQSYGYAYIDSAKFDYPSNLYANVEEEFKATTNSTYTVVTDLSDMFASKSQENFAKSYYFTGTQVNAVEKHGIINLNSAHLDEVIYNANDLDAFKLTDAKNVYGIRATDDVHYTITSNIGYSLKTDDNKFYKISVDVFTQNLDTNNSKIEKSKLGAGIKLTGFDDSFTEIQSNGSWTTYTFYISAKKEITTYLEFSIGSENALTKGDVFFGNVVFTEDVTKDEYDNAVASSALKVITNAADEETEKEDNKETSKDNQSNKNVWLYLIPSLLTAAAIVIAVIGIAARKIKWKKPVKKTKTSYDRNKTVSVQYYNRKATMLREEKVRELTADLEKISSQRKTFEDDYKVNLTKLREMKIKRANPADIAKFEKEMKKNQKLSANLGVTANRIASDLEYVKTDAYLNSLIRKLQKEPVTGEQNENKE